MNIPSADQQKPRENPEDFSEILLSLEIQSKLAESAELARSGNYGQAEGLLKTVMDWQKSALALDLMARICVQQGKVEDAAQYWESAIKLSPSNLSYQSGLEYATKLKRPISNISRVLTWVLGISVLLALIFVFTLVSKQASKQEPSSIVSNNAQISTLQSQVLGLYHAPMIEVTSTIVPTATFVPTSTPNGLAEISITVSGLKTANYGDAVIVYPEKEMFVYTWSLTPDARTMITELGHQLEPYAARISITLVGFAQASEQSQYFDVGLTRSTVVYGLLESST